MTRWLADREWLNLSRLPRLDRRQMVLVALIAAGLIVLAGLANIGCRVMRAWRPSPRTGYPSAQVTRVRSGDTLRIDRNDELLALAGIRAPSGDEAQSEESRRRCAELVLNQAIDLEYDTNDRDSDGRVLAYVRCGEVCANVTLVEEGLAWVRLTPGTQRRAAELLAAQARARKARRGVWAAPPPAIEKAYELESTTGLFHRPGCGAAAQRATHDSRDACLEQGVAPCPQCRP